MLTLQTTFLRPPYPASFSIPLSSNFAPVTLPADCHGLPGTNVLLLEVHLEGNLGDEMETTPLLKELKRCGIHITAVLSRWLERPEQRVGAASVREHELLDAILSPPAVENLAVSSGDYHAVILAPGPWRLCPLQRYWPYRIDIFMGGSIIPDAAGRDCDLSERLAGWKPSLMVVREPDSFERIQNLPSMEGVTALMSGDLSHSFQPVNATLEYWKKLYGNYAKRILIFARGSNADNVVQSVDGNVEVSTLMYGKVTLPAVQVIFATSSPLEDSAWMQQGKERFANFREHQFIQCETVEQLWGLISQSRHVFTDRYHPGVVAHMLDKNFTVLEYKEEETKLAGLSKLVESQNYKPAALRDEHNPRAFEALYDTLRRLRARPAEVSKSVASKSDEDTPDSTVDQPYAIVVGLPKSGTTSIYYFFSCSGYHTTHYCCCGSSGTEYPCTGGKQFSQQLWDNMKAGRPLWDGTGNMTVHAQLDGESKTEAYFLPQHYHLKELDDSAPKAIWILPLRSAQSWKKSVESWLDMGERLRVVYQQRYPSARGFDLEMFYNNHTQLIRNYCAKHRQNPNLCVEVEIDDPNAGRHLAKHFRNAVASCWGRHNAGPFFQAFPPKS